MAQYTCDASCTLTSLYSQLRADSGLLLLCTTSNSCFDGLLAYLTCDAALLGRPTRFHPMIHSLRHTFRRLQVSHSVDARTGTIRAALVGKLQGGSSVQIASDMRYQDVWFVAAFAHAWLQAHSGAAQSVISTDLNGDVEAEEMV